MTRRPPDPSALWLLGGPVALALILVSTDLFLVVALFAAVVWAMVATAQRDETAGEWGAEVFKTATWKAKAEQLEAECQRLHVALAEHEIAGGTLPRARLRSVPLQRKSSEWPAIVRAVEGETGGAP